MDILDAYNKEASKEQGNLPSQQRRLISELEDRHIYRPRVILGQLQTPAMVSWVFRHSSGMLKTERQAAHVLLGIACLVGIVALLLFMNGIRGPYIRNGGPGLTPEEIEIYRKFQPF